MIKWAKLARQPVLFSFGVLSLSPHQSIAPVCVQGKLILQMALPSNVFSHDEVSSTHDAIAGASEGAA